MTPHFSLFLFFFFFNDTATTEIYTLSLHDALPIHGTRRGRVEPSALDAQSQLHPRAETQARAAAQDGSPCAFHAVPRIDTVLGHRQGSERGHGALSHRRAGAERDSDGPKPDRRRRRAQGPTPAAGDTRRTVAAVLAVLRPLIAAFCPARSARRWAFTTMFPGISGWRRSPANATAPVTTAVPAITAEPGFRLPPRCRLARTSDIRRAAPATTSPLSRSRAVSSGNVSSSGATSCRISK